MTNEANATIDAQGWDNNSLLDILDDFITQRGLQNELAKYLEERTSEENVNELPE